MFKQLDIMSVNGLTNMNTFQLPLGSDIVDVFVDEMIGTHILHVVLEKPLDLALKQVCLRLVIVQDSSRIPVTAKFVKSVKIAGIWKFVYKDYS